MDGSWDQLEICDQLPAGSSASLSRSLRHPYPALREIPSAGAFCSRLKGMLERQLGESKLQASIIG
jgi:hypothetical protein